MKLVRERMDILSAYREVGSYHGAAKICSTTPKTVKRVVEAAERSEPRPPPAHNYDEVTDLVAQRVEKTKGRISAKRLLPAAIAAGYTGSDRNFRRLVAEGATGEPITTGDVGRACGNPATCSRSTGA